MPPPLLFSTDGIDWDQTLFTREEIYQSLPHRHEFQQLDGICYFYREQNQGIAYRDIRSDEWWVRGHFPERPLFPGVLMLETGAQMAAFLAHIITGSERLLALGGVDDGKFREPVVWPYSSNARTGWPRTPSARDLGTDDPAAAKRTRARYDGVSTAPAARPTGPRAESAFPEERTRVR